ncbi:MAG: DUF3127 domain-containing protein [Bacteroidota bacterium]
MDVTGVLKVKGETVRVSDKFTKREFVITDNSSQYPQHISFQLTQDKCSLLDAYQVGSEIKVHFNLRGREWTSPQGELKHFNSLEALRIEGGGASNKSNSSAEASSSSAPTPIEPLASSSMEDDLPF